MYEQSATAADKIHLPTYFKTRFMELYKQNSVHGHFSNAEEMSEFFEDAIAILEFVKKKRNLFFFDSVFSNNAFGFFLFLDKQKRIISR